MPGVGCLIFRNQINILVDWIKNKVNPASSPDSGVSEASNSEETLFIPPLPL